MKRVFGHFIVATLFFITPALAAGPASPRGGGRSPQSSEPIVFNISYRGTPIGQESVVITRTDAGWKVSSTGGQTAPSPFTIDKFEAQYSRTWQPLSLEIEARSGDQLLSLRSTFTATTASTDV